MSLFSFQFFIMLLLPQQVKCLTYLLNTEMLCVVLGAVKRLGWGW